MRDELRRRMIDARRLREQLSYDPSTGVFVWVAPTNRRIVTGRQAGTLNHGYVQIKVLGRPYRAHRLAWLYMTGEWPKKSVDHINRDRSDNRWCNLRLATRSQNQFNRTKQPNNTSGYKGVTWCKTARKWRAQIGVAGKNIWLGNFSSPEIAGLAYENAAHRFHGDFART